MALWLLQEVEVHTVAVFYSPLLDEAFASAVNILLKKIMHPDKVALIRFAPVGGPEESPF